MSTHAPRRHASYEKAPWVSEIQDKGDLFYVEQYVDDPNTGHSTAQQKQTSEQYQQNGGQVIKDKRLTGNKLLDFISQMKKTKKTDIGISQKDNPNQDQDRAGKEKDMKFEVKLRVHPPRIGPYKRDDLESVLGIIPLKSVTANDRDELSFTHEYGRDSRIVIAGFTPTGPAIRSHQLEIGDSILALNGLEININNVNAILGAIPGSVEVTLKIQKHSPPPAQSPFVNGFIPNDNHLLRIINGKKKSDHLDELQNTPHAAMFLSLDISSEDEVEKDIIFQFPKDSVTNKVVSLRGIFLTLGDLLTSVTGSSPRSTSVVIDGELIHIGYQKFKQEILVLALPAKRACLFHMEILMQNLNQLLCLMFGSLHRAFCDDCNTLRLEHFFSLIFEYILGTRSIFATSSKSVDPLDGFLNCIEGARWLDLPSESKVHIDTCLNELEANDCEWAELLTMRRQYLVLGSCLFYKGVLIGNHLPIEDLQDLVHYCRFHCLFTTSKQQRLAQLVIWREIFLTKERKECSDAPLKANFQSRTFLLVVGLKHFLFCIILEAGVISQRANGNPGPDPYYIDQAKNILYELESLDIPAVCDERFENPSGPPTVTADQSVLRSKSVSVEKMSHDGKARASTGSVENIKSSGVEETESVHSGMSGGPLSPYRRRRQSSNVSDASKESTGSIKTSRSATAVPLTLAKLRKDTENTGDLKFNYLNKLNSGEENTVFHYVIHNIFHGIIMSPFVTASRGKLHDAVLENFNKACLKIKRHFRRNSMLNKNKSCSPQEKFSSTSSDTIAEMGIQFCVPDTKRQGPLLKYWVKGRLIFSGGPKEFYVCYQDSASQNSVELAFKLGFGSPL
ncbi:protein inturned-like isoform X2 [Dendronephthya gigantea]|uniref:protein inturned-like isoform X2 n=1 Tax=Dendronephthya gigantea TaxID=151771 RepID=UPI00106AC834|nr:protein inturned-like isoform X2 [Dendronephthya gigantea]